MQFSLWSKTTGQKDTFLKLIYADTIADAVDKFKRNGYKDAAATINKTTANIKTVFGSNYTLKLEQ